MRGRLKDFPLLALSPPDAKPLAWLTRVALRFSHLIPPTADWKASLGGAGENITGKRKKTRGAISSPAGGPTV